MMRTARRAAVAGLLLLGAAAPAVAHPHVTVGHQARIVFEKGAIVAIDHIWYFDEFYSAMAIEGLDTNKDGKYSREELAELTKTNVDGLKDFDYFTHPVRGTDALKLGHPDSSKAWSEVKDGVVALHFRLPLAAPADPKGFQVSIYDPSYFIAFDFQAKDPVVLDGAPAGCKAEVGVPKQEAADAKKLGESFFQQLGGGNYGLGIAKTVTVQCK